VNTSAIWVALSVVSLAIVAVLLFFVARRGRDANKLSPLASLGFAFVLAGIVLGDDRLVSYSLIGIGIVLALVDIFSRRKSHRPDDGPKL
jgi:drug/metabolite transporter (DMT)-like permease